MSEIKTGLHSGHRQRMRTKFNEYGRDVFHTHELLEMLLFHVVSYRNTNTIAQNLMQRFSTLDAILTADRDELMRVDGVGPKIADLLSAIGAVELPSLGADSFDREAEKFDDYRKVGQFFADYFSGKQFYETVVLLLNSKMEYIDLCSVYKLDCDSGGIKAEPFINIAVENNASVAVIAHNHPYGPLFPSIGDKATNSMLEEAMTGIGIVLAEHYIVCGNDFVGFMNNLSTAFSQPCAVEKFYESKRIGSD